jgi:penicillin-binding protein 1A
MTQQLVIRNTKDSATGEVEADYVAEMVRQAMYERYQDDIYSNGLKVYTTLRKADQDAANQALWKGVEEYDDRHGYRGAEGNIALPADTQNLANDLDNAMQELTAVHDLIPAVVLANNTKSVRVYIKDIGTTEISGAGIKFAQRYLTGANKNALHSGALIRVQKINNTDQWRITQLPQVAAAFVSLDPHTGAIKALVGGVDYNYNKFNHVTQAWRQPGSTIKPFIYSAALEKGFTAATLVEDAPIHISADETGGVLWEPKNYEGDYAGIVSFRTALTKSLNLPTIRILQSITPSYAQDYLTRFGFDAARQPPYLTLALGAGSVTPLQLAAGYAVFANKGLAIKPYIIDHITDAQGKTLLQTQPEAAKPAIDPRNAFIITSLMQDVVRRGTAARVNQLGRSDLAGKTGTTNDQVDAWFAGFQPNLVAVAWVGFDQPRTLGHGETGAQAALPIWMKYMSVALKGVPQAAITPPDGITKIQINPLTGLPVSNGDTGVYEYFYQEAVPVAKTQADANNADATDASTNTNTAVPLP